MSPEAPVDLQVPGGPRLEAWLALPDEPLGGLVICHPHPLYGGDMDNPVVIRVAEVAQAAGLATVRFNFRGVGASQGTHDGGPGERDDASAALALLADRVPGGRPLGLCGYSFGAWVVAGLAGASGASRALCLVAPPLAMLDFAGVAEWPAAVLLVGGTRDAHCPVDGLRRLADRIPGAVVSVVEGADHFFFGKLYPLGAAVEAWLRGWAAR